MNFKSATAETEYAKDPKISRDDIQALKLWVKEQPHLPDVTGTKLIFSFYFEANDLLHIVVKDNFQTIQGFPG